MTINRDTPFYLIATILFLLFKFGYTLAETSDLVFLIGPTNSFVELLTAQQSSALAENGYFYKELNIVIDKSCSGFNFWLLCSTMLSFLALRFFEKRISKVLVLASSYVIGYVFTVLVNSSRIFSSIIIESQNIPFIPPAVLHESIGVVTNLTFLVLIYLLSERLLTQRNRNEKFA